MLFIYKININQEMTMMQNKEDMDYYFQGKLENHLELEKLGHWQLSRRHS